jgi:hypothetical protein
MKINKLSLLVAIGLCFVTLSWAQKGRYRITNGFTLAGGVSLFDIATDNFETSQETGFLGGIAATVDLPHKWYNLSFGMQFSKNTVGIAGRPSLISTENTFIDYDMLAVQLSGLLHIKLISKYLTIDLGPMLQYNGNLEFADARQENYFITNYVALSADAIRNISQFNVNGAIGLSAGFKHVMLRAQYIYGFTNTLEKLNTENLNTLGGPSEFKGNQTLLVLGAIVTF